MTLIDALFASIAAPDLRRILLLREGPVGHLCDIKHTVVEAELLYVRMRRVSAEKSSCDVLAGLSRIENGEIRKEAADVLFRCVDVSALDWHSSFCAEAEIPSLSPSSEEVEIDAQDGFRIVCRRIEVLEVRPDELGSRSSEQKLPNRVAGSD